PDVPLSPTIRNRSWTFCANSALSAPATKAHWLPPPWQAIATRLPFMSDFHGHGFRFMAAARRRQSGGACGGSYRTPVAAKPAVNDAWIRWREIARHESQHANEVKAMREQYTKTFLGMQAV